jgi:hypothetical protein
MQKAFVKWMRIALAALLAAATAATAQLPVVSGEPALTLKSTAVPKLRLSPDSATVVKLSPITDSEVASVRRANLRANQKRFVIGVSRALADAPLPGARDLAWSEVQGGMAAQVAVDSPGAGAMRIALDLAGVPDDVEMVFFGSDAPGRLVGPLRAGEIPDRSAPWWSPVTDGETQTIELFVPGSRDPRALPLRLSGASHVFTTIASRLAKRTQDIGDAGSCNVDIKCSSLQGSQAFLNARNSVAQMVFNDGGFTGLCSGQILNDTDAATQAPWFYSANHCFENESLPFKSTAQMQAVAASLNTLWFFEAVSCGSLTPPPYSQLVDGAAFIYNNPGTDVLFLRLNSAPPPGAYFAGWDPNPVPVGASIVVIHHPQGDLKKVSQGSVLRYSTPQPPLLGGASSPFSEVKYTTGTTEGGSSGAGLWTFDGSQYLLRGGLYGGGAFCSTPNESDWYSQIDKAYPSLASYLSPAAGGATDYSDLWWNASESGWGLNVIQHASRNIFAVWFTYREDGRPTWFTLPGGTWTSSSTFTGSIYSTAGPPASAASFDSRQVKVAPVGTGTLTFSDANNGTWAYTINGVSGSKAIARQPY